MLDRCARGISKEATQLGKQAIDQVIGDIEDKMATDYAKRLNMYVF